jgi:hypothetical protein
LENVRGSQSAVPVVRAEAGAGKTALFHALVSDDGDAERCYRDAIDHLSRTKLGIRSRMSLHDALPERDRDAMPA